jgi:phage gpG-like protein
VAESVQFDATEIAKVFDELLERGQRVGEEVMPAMAEILVSAVQEEFETGGRGKWKELADSTLAKRRREGKGAKILEDTGIFAGSITQDVGADFAEAYTNVPYAIFHTSDEPRTLIPYRNPFDVDQDATGDEMVRLILDAAVPG